MATEQTEVMKLSPMAFFVGLLFVLVIAGFAIANIKVQWGSKTATA